MTARQAAKAGGLAPMAGLKSPDPRNCLWLITKQPSPGRTLVSVTGSDRYRQLSVAITMSRSTTNANLNQQKKMSSHSKDSDKCHRYRNLDSSPPPPRPRQSLARARPRWPNSFAIQSSISMTVTVAPWQPQWHSLADASPAGHVTPPGSGPSGGPSL